MVGPLLGVLATLMIVAVGTTILAAEAPLAPKGPLQSMQLDVAVHDPLNPSVPPAFHGDVAGLYLLDPTGHGPVTVSRAQAMQAISRTLRPGDSVQAEVLAYAFEPGDYENGHPPTHGQLCWVFVVHSPYAQPMFGGQDVPPPTVKMFGYHASGGLASCNIGLRVNHVDR